MIIRLRGRSMIPTLRPGDVLWFRRVAGVGFTRGAMVLAKLPPPHQGLIVKRVVGLPGETVAITAGRVLINGQPLAEPYVSVSAALEPSADVSFPLPSDGYLLLGDARDDSLDSRRLGPVTHAAILGEATSIVWPPHRWKRLSGLS